VKNFIDEIASMVADAAVLDAAEVRRSLAPPPDKAMGDIGFPCFVLAKKEKSPPPKIAAALADKLKPTERIEKISAAGPYLNFTFNRAAFIREVLDETAVAGGDYGSADTGAGRTVVIDFSSPNVAKPFGVGHLRSTVIGAALARIFRALGYRAVGVNHIGDWGTQFGNMIAAYRRWGSEDTFKGDAVKKMYELYVRFHKEAEKDEALADEGRANFHKLEAGEADETNLWQRFVDTSLREFERIYDLLGVSFDAITGESFYNDRMDAALEKVAEARLLVDSQGARGVDLGDRGLEFAMLEKSDGATVYLTRDLAAAMFRRETYLADKILYVVGAPQALHFKQLQAVLEKLDESWSDRIVHVAFGHILGMSTRKGTLVFAQDFIDEADRRAMDIIKEKNPDLEDAEHVAGAVALGAIIFNDVGQRRIKDVEFDWERMLSLDGDTGPYLQNVHVRIAGILRKHKGAVPADADTEALTEPEEYALVKEIARFPDTLQRAADEYEPSILAGYLIDLAHAFHAFYQKHRVLKAASGGLRDARLRLIGAVRTVIGRGLALLGIEPLERM
jgi:arginyl-tRNA synthetase